LTQIITQAMAILKGVELEDFVQPESKECSDKFVLLGRFFCGTPASQLSRYHILDCPTSIGMSGNLPAHFFCIE